MDLVDQDWELYLRTRLAPSGAGVSVDYLRQATSPADYKIRARAFRASNLEDLLPSLATPTLLLHARDLVDIHPEESVKLAARIANARLVLIDGATWMGDADQSLKAIDDFLASLPPPATTGVPVLAGLSQREVEVLRLIAAGRSNQDIASELVISLNTVARHVSNIFDKIGAKNRTEAAGYARDRGLIAPR